MILSASSQIDREPGAVFDLMADARNEPRWNSQVSTSTMQGDEPVGEGSRFVTVNRGRSYDATILVYERPRRLVFEVAGAQMDITASFSFAPQGSGTAVEASFDFRPKGPMKILMLVLKPLVRLDVRKQSASFKALCEST